MKNVEHVKFIWQLLALRKRFGVNPYSLLKEELQILKEFEMTEVQTDGPSDF
jgi:hypothetical protein